MLVKRGTLRLVVNNIHIDEDEFDQPHPLIYLQSEGVFAIIVSYGAYASVVRYEKEGQVWEVLVENDEILDGDS